MHKCHRLCWFPLQKNPHLHAFKHQVERVRLLKVLQQLEDVVLPPAEVECLDLLQGGRAGERGGGGVDLLHCNLEIG